MEELCRQSERIDRSIVEQNRFLDHCLAHRKQLTIFLESGVQFIGIVREHDRKSILLSGRSRNKEPRMIHKSSVAYIKADENLELFLPYRGLGTALQRRRRRRLIRLRSPRKGV
ncbi:RNA chaperone Hfq [Geopseudomonas aromaticivorans]